MLSILYVHFNTPYDLARSIASIHSSARTVPYEIIIIDNASSQKPRVKIRSSSVKIIVNKINIGYGKALNQGVKIARGEYLLFVNPDTILHRDSIALLYKRIEDDSKIGVIGPQMTDKNGTVQQSYNGMPFLPDALFAFSFLNTLFPKNKFSRRYWLSDLDVTKEQWVSFVGGACMMVRREVFDMVGGFDERFFMYFDEVDFCYRVKQIGYKILCYPDAKVVHLVGRSSRDRKRIQKIFESSRFKFFQKYHGTAAALVGDGILRILNSPIRKLIRI